jgi:hypothetical protein
VAVEAAEEADVAVQAAATVEEAAEIGAAQAAATAAEAATAEAAVAAEAATAARGKCTRQPAQIAGRSAKFHSSRLKEGRYIAETALQSTGHTKFLFLFQFFYFFNQ